MADRIGVAMEALAAMLASDLRESADRAEEAHQLLLGGNRNGAIGALLQAEAMIDRIAAIKTALLGLHRTGA